MNIIQFSSQFPDESACIAHFKAQRGAVGVVCPKCGCTHHWWLQGKLRYQCSQCGYRQSLRAGTALENTKLPFMY
jgi:transposase-like protein